MLFRSEATELERTAWVRAILTDPGVVLDAKSRLQAKYPLVVEVDMRPDGGDAGADGTAVPDVRRVTAEEAMASFWEEANDAPPTDAETALMHGALGAARAKAEVAV